MYEESNKDQLKALLSEEADLKALIESLEEQWMEEQEKLPED